MALLNRTGWQLVAGAGVIFLVGCSSGGGGGSSAPQTPTAPSFSLQPLDQTQPAGGGVTFTVAAVANGTLGYQWTKDGTALAGATAATYTHAGLKAADAGAYACKVTNTVGGSSVTTQSSSALLVVNVPPVIATQPDPNPSLVEGGTVTLTVGATGNGVLSYQWQKDGKGIPGATKATFVLTNATATDAGTYTCVVTATLNGTVTTTITAPAVLGVGQVPTLVAQPTALQTVVQGNPVTFSVTATGTGALTYQWLKDGQPLTSADATTNTLTLAAAMAADAGVYTCAVTNTVNGIPGTLATSQAVLAVNVPPQVSAISSQVVGQGGSVTFSVAATGNGTLSYQWSKAGTDLPGATAPSLTLTGVQPGDAADYVCTVTNTLNDTATTTTTDATLAVNPGPAIAPLADQTQAQGGAAAFTVVATYQGTPSYQWLMNGGVIDPTVNPSAATATLTLANLAVADGGSYSCVVTDTVNGIAASSTSNPATLFINQLPQFSGPIASQGFTVAGGTATFTASATSNGTVTYQWYQGAAPSGTPVGASNSTGLLVLTGLQATADGAAYYCVATSTLNGSTTTATSTSATLVLDGAPTFVIQPPATLTAAVGGSVTLTVSATGNGTVGYQWYKGALGLGTLIPGATSASYTLPSVAKTDAGSKYYCVATNVLSGATMSASSSVATLAVNWAPTWDTMDYGAPSFSFSNPTLAKQGATEDMTGFGVPAIVDQTTQPATGTVAYTYQWYKNGTPISAGGTLTIITNSYTTADSGLKIVGAQVSDIGSYTCVATRTLNGAAAVASAPSSAVSLFVLATPVITSQPASTTVNQGTPATFTVTAAPPANGTLFYQWYKGPLGSGAPITGGTTPTLTLSSPKATDTATTYYCTVTNKDTVNAPSLTNAVNTSLVTLTVDPVLASAPVTIDPTVAAGKTDLVATTPDAGPLVTYAWTVTDANLVNLISGSSTLRTVSYTAPAATAGPVTATVMVTSLVDGTSVSGTAKALVKSVAFVAPDIIAPPVVHPGDTWMKAFTTPNTGETYAWTYLQGTVAKGGTWTSGSNTTATLGFYSTTTTNPMNDTFTLSLNGQLNGDNATTTAPVNVRTGAWVTKDGSTSTFLGSYPTATPLANGRVLITGGQLYSASSAYLTANTAYIYDPGTGRIVPTGAMTASRTQHTATLLDNGMVLVVGGMSVALTGTSSSATATTYLSSAELWDPATGQWTALPAPMLNPRVMHCAYKFTDGSSRVAIIGGSNNGTAVGAIEIFNPATQTWTTGATLKIPRYNHTITVLANDPVNGRAITDAGKVLILGGTGGSGSGLVNTNAQAQPELFDPVALTTAKTTSLTQVVRTQHTATLLKDGNVLIVGGSGTNAGNTAEVFNPGIGLTGTGTFVKIGTTPVLGGALGATPSGRSQHTANLLPDGTVLLAGGNGVNGAADKSTSWSMELFTPSGAPTSGGTFTYANAAPSVVGVTGSMHESHIAHASAQLPSGQVVLVGGKTPASTLNVSSLVELFTPVNGSTPASLTVPVGLESGRLFHQTVQFPSQKIMVIGGVGTLAGNLNANYSYATLDSCRIYDPTTQTWTATGPLNIPRKDFAVALLSNGCVLVTGGRTPLNPSGDASAELWNPAANEGLGAWTLLPSYLNSARCLHSMVALQDGRVLVMGGANGAGGLATCEIYADGTFTLLPASGSMSEPKGYLTPILIPSGANAGKVVIVGGASGNPATSSATASAQVEVFDPTTNTWNKNMTPLQHPRALHNTVLLPSGKLVVLGGMTTLSSGSGVYAGIDPGTFQAVAGTATETYDLTLNSGFGGSVQWAPGVYSNAVWTADGHRGAGAVLVANGGPNNNKVLVVGGAGATASGAPPAFNFNSGAVVEVYDPATDTFSATNLDPLPVPRRYNFFGGNDTNEFTVNVMGGTSSVTKSDVIVIGGAFSGGAANIIRP